MNDGSTAEQTRSFPERLCTRGGRGCERAQEAEKREKRGREGVEREERKPGKALGCNFSRYIRDGSRNESGKERIREKGAEREEKSRLRISAHRGDDQPDGCEPDYSRGIFQLSKPSRFLFSDLSRIPRGSTTFLLLNKDLAANFRGCTLKISLMHHYSFPEGNRHSLFLLHTRINLKCNFNFC